MYKLGLFCHGLSPIHNLHRQTRLIRLNAAAACFRRCCSYRWMAKVVCVENLLLSTNRREEQQSCPAKPRSASVWRCCAPESIINRVTSSSTFGYNRFGIWLRSSSVQEWGKAICICFTSQYRRCVAAYHRRQKPMDNHHGRGVYHSAPTTPGRCSRVRV